MARRTKKVKSTGRFGVRYGARLRKDVRRIEEVSKALHRCPRCRLQSVKRQSVGIWKCRKCDYLFTGGAWEPITNVGKRVNRTARQIEERKHEI